MRHGSFKLSTLWGYVFWFFKYQNHYSLPWCGTIGTVSSLILFWFFSSGKEVLIRIMLYDTILVAWQQKRRIVGFSHTHTHTLHFTVKVCICCNIQFLFQRKLFWKRERKRRKSLSLSLSSKNYNLRSQIRQDYPLNLSILISGGKETNKDSLSNGEWSGKSSNLKSLGATSANCSLKKAVLGSLPA